MEKYRERIQSIFAFPLQSLTLFFNLPLPSEYPTIEFGKESPSGYRCNARFTLKNWKLGVCLSFLPYATNLTQG